MLGSVILALYDGHCHTCYMYWAVSYLLYMLGSVILALYAEQWHTCFICWAVSNLLYMLGSVILALYAGQCHTCYICWAASYLLYMLGSREASSRRRSPFLWHTCTCIFHVSEDNKQIMQNVVLAANKLVLEAPH